MWTIIKEMCTDFTLYCRKKRRMNGRNPHNIRGEAKIHITEKVVGIYIFVFHVHI